MIRLFAAPAFTGAQKIIAGFRLAPGITAALPIPAAETAPGGGNSIAGGFNDGSSGNGSSGGGGAPDDRPGVRRWARLQFWNQPSSLPLLLLLAAMATLFLFGNERTYFYRDGHHDGNSSKTLTLAENLSFRHGLLLFFYQFRDADGDRHYPEPYSRFPVGGFALVKLAILPFGDDAYRAKIYVGRMLMLALFSAAAALAYHSLARLISNRWDALTATLLAFSSWYLLYYSDMIFNEVTIDLFAVMLVFHGMVIFIQEGRFRQLLIKSGIALLLGWHVYAFLLPFVLFGLVREGMAARRSVASLSAWRQLQGYGAALRRSRYLILGAAALLFGIAILTFNLSNEYLALDGAVELRELPSVKSAVKRLGGNERYNARYAAYLSPGAFMSDQFYRIGNMLLPYAISPHEVKARYASLAYRDYPLVVFGALTFGCCLAVLVGLRRRRPELLPLLGTLTVAGFCWALPLRASVIDHDFESVFYIGIPLTAFALLLLFLRRMSPIRLAPAFAVAALALFAFSSAEMAGVGQSRDDIESEAEQMADYAAIRELVDDSGVVHMAVHPLAGDWGGASWAATYFLAGKSVSYAGANGFAGIEQRPGDYLLLPVRENGPALLTPENRHFFLYDWSHYTEQYREEDLGSPIIEANWNVYLTADRLVYVSEGCSDKDATFLLHLVPRNSADLAPDRKEHGYNNHDFDFQAGNGVHIGQSCVVERPLPDYDLSIIRTGQYISSGSTIWADDHELP